MKLFYFDLLRGLTKSWRRGIVCSRLVCANLLVIFFVLVMSGFGLVISNYSATMQQSMFVMFFFMLILMLMSGLFTPISSMPEWAQAITVFNPLKYFIEAMRMVYLKGSGLVDLLPEIGILSLFAVFFNSWAVISYRKSR